MFSFRKSLGFRLLLASVILLSLPLLVDSFVLIQGRLRDLKEDSKRILVDTSNLRHASVLQMVNKKDKFIDGPDLSKNLRDLLKPELRDYPIHFALLTSSYRVIAAGDAALLKQVLFIDKTKSNPPFLQFNLNGEEQMGYLSSFSKDKFFLLTYASIADIWADPFLDYWEIYHPAIIILFFGTLVATLVVFWMARPMSQLKDVMKKISKGQWNHRYREELIGFEINDLGKIFNQMVDSLLENQKKGEEERLQREILGRELMVGQRVQRSLLPEKLLQVQGVEFAEVYIPAIQVGGDFFDLFEVKEGEKRKIMMSIADASGKGIQACYYSLGVRTMLRALANVYSDLGLLMQKINRLFCQDTQESGMFITALVGTYDPETKELCYYSCGHNSPMICRKNGEIELLPVQDIAMGLIDKESKREGRVVLNSGDLILFYTDGITEAHDAQNHLFGEKRLADSLRSNRERSARQIVSKLMEEIALFTSTTPQHDDMTLLLMRVK